MKNRKVIVGVIVVSLIVAFVVLGSVLAIPPWARIKPPYFEYSMGEIYKEVSFKEVKKNVDFNVVEPGYVPGGLDSYKVAIRVKPQPNSLVVFYTPEFPGVKPGPLSGLKISQAKNFEAEDQSFIEGAKKIKINKANAWLQEDNGNSVTLFLKNQGTATIIEWYGQELNKNEVLKIAKNLLEKS